MEFHEQEDGTWRTLNKYFPIVSDNRATHYNVMPLINNKNIYFQLTNVKDKKCII